MCREQRKKDISLWYQEHGNAIFNYILIMVQDFQIAEDLTQEAFLKAYRFYNTYNKLSNEKTWLFSVARNTTIDYIRKRKPLQLLKEFLPYSKKDESPLPEDLLILKENAYELYFALSKLRSSYREVIVLRKIKGLSIRETSKVLNWSESKVKTTLNRAMKELSNHYSGGHLNDKE